MKSGLKKSLTLALAITCGAAVFGQRPGGQEPPGKPGRPDKPGRFELGRVMPPPIREALDLNETQKKQIQDLEQEVKARLEKILSAEQIKKAVSMSPLPGGGGPGGPGKPLLREGGPSGPGGDKPERPRPQADNEQKARANGGGIAWFATLEAGRREAARTGRPILLVSAAPHCAGVSGIW